MHRYIWTVAVLTTLLGLGGCGIPEEQHQATLDALKKVKAEMAADKKSSEETKADLEKRNKTISDENAVMKAKLLSLGQDLTKMKTQAGAMVQNISAKEKQIADLLKAQEAGSAARGDVQGPPRQVQADDRLRPAQGGDPERSNDREVERRDPL